MAGGNYNLRYLSADARRDITPFPAVQASKSAGPSLGLRQSSGYTFYVPGAGFLWTDPMIWNQSMPDDFYPGNSTDHYNGDLEDLWSVEGSYRAFFQDKFIERYPWEVRTVRQQWQSQRTSHIKPSTSVVHLYDSVASRYLCVIPGERVVSEAGYFGKEEDEISRIRVG